MYVLRQCDRRLCGLSLSLTHRLRCNNHGTADTKLLLRAMNKTFCKRGSIRTNSLVFGVPYSPTGIKTVGRGTICIVCVLAIMCLQIVLFPKCFIRFSLLVQSK